MAFQWNFCQIGIISIYFTVRFIQVRTGNFVIYLNQSVVQFIGLTLTLAGNSWMPDKFSGSSTFFILFETTGFGRL